MRRSIRLSQNFLSNQPLVDQLVAQAGFGTNDTVLDIGAGSGSITRALASRAGHVTAYEADERLATMLVGKFLSNPSVQVIMGDFMTADLPLDSYKVFANIPFNKTSEIVHRLLDGFNPPVDSFLIMQREAAQKFAGVVGRQSLFAILHAPWFSFETQHTFHARDFTPQPKVAIVLLRINHRAEALAPASEAEPYRDFVSYIFNHANPNVLPSLKLLFPGKSFGTVERALGSKVTAKPSQLELHDWLALFSAFVASATATQKQTIRGASNKLQHEAKSIEKHHRTRSARNWRQS